VIGHVVPTKPIDVNTGNGGADKSVGERQSTQPDHGSKSSDEQLAAIHQVAQVIAKSKWDRTKSMLVGGGRAGKTAFAKTILGLPFVPTDSTIGIEETTLNVTFAAIGSQQPGNWNSVGEDGQLRGEYELALAKAVLNKQVGPYETNLWSY
jgi:hypothetical protein